MTYHRVCYKSNTTGATSGAKSAPYRAHVEVFVLLNIYFVDHCLFFFFCPLFVLFLLLIVLLILRFTTSGCRFGNFKPFVTNRNVDIIISMNPKDKTSSLLLVISLDLSFKVGSFVVWMNHAYIYIYI